MSLDQQDLENNQVHYDRMPFLEHLGELRTRLIRCFFALLVCVLVAYNFRIEILDFIRKPIDAPLKKYTHNYKVTTPQIKPKDLSKYNCQCTETKQETSKKDNSPKKTLTNQVSKKDALKKNILIKKTTKEGKTQTKSLQLSCSCTIKTKATKAVKPVETKGYSSMVFIDLPEVFFSQMKVAFFAGLFFSFPYLLMEIWSFVAPALYRGEKKLFWVFALATFVCFTGGALFGYTTVFPYGFDFFLSLTQPEKIMPSLSIGQYLSFSLKLLFAFGIIFELPLVIFVLSRMGILTPEFLIKNIHYAILGIFVVAAILTPPDPFTMLLMAAPLVLLYIIGIAVSFVGVNRKKVALREKGYDDEVMP
ncbi:MAG: sec-independent protein translocase protein TatC [bacterium]|jgi:sec-independent protein translocase protein TatC